MTKSISNISSLATELTNTTGVLSNILEVQPEDGTQLIFRNHVERGQQSLGIPIFAELQESAGDDLPLDTRLALQFERPADDNPTVVSEPLDNIRPYRALSVKEQQNEEFVDRVKNVLKGNALVVDDVDKMYVALESSAQIDWSNSRLQFDESAVCER